MTAVYAFIAGEESNYPVVLMCRWSKVSTSGFYAWRTRLPSATERRRRSLAVLIRALFDASDGTYGYRRIHAEMLRSGFFADDDTVRLIMRELGLQPCQRRPFRPVTSLADEQAAAGVPDLVRRDFTAARPGVKLVGDITYIPTWEGFVYLATVLDCGTKKCVGYALADHMRADLTEAALDMAVRNVPIVAGETIFHTDRGSQYMGAQMAAAAKHYGIRRSVGRTGVCWDAWLSQLSFFLGEQAALRVALTADRHVFAQRHRHRPGHQAGESGREDRSALGRCSGYPDDETGHRHDAVVGSQDSRSQPV